MNTMLRCVLNLLNNSIFGRTIGSLSCVVGLVCYALSFSFKSLFGEWNPTKIVLYIILSSIISFFVLFAGKSRVLGVSKLKRHVEFLVLMLTSLYSFFADRSTKGKPDTLSLVSSGAFALTSLCLSRQIKPGFDVGLFNFFLGCVTIQLMRIHLLFILVAAGFCYALVVLGSYSESQSENGDSSAKGSVETRIDGDDVTPRTFVRNVSSNSLTQDDDRSGSFSNMSENGDWSGEGSVAIRIDDGDDAARNEGISNSFGMGEDKAGQIGPRRRLRSESLFAPNPPPSLPSQTEAQKFLAMLNSQLAAGLKPDAP